LTGVKIVVSSAVVPHHHHTHTGSQNEFFTPKTSVFKQYRHQGCGFDSQIIHELRQMNALWIKKHLTMQKCKCSNENCICLCI